MGGARDFASNPLELNWLRASEEKINKRPCLLLELFGTYVFERKV